ncbi:hypothetical protein cyc_01857 [Cyclospora cayetanensis]|uniref:Uncharacterized protein n=1 Tax=Cyclospora cayetanensis TaxID=88456 RepID=A0A1D3D6C9_9EIME|nr:hypothetical protein cyc_01857 [Cyclospora cayetanensis]
MRSLAAAATTSVASALRKDQAEEGGEGVCILTRRRRRWSSSHGDGGERIRRLRRRDETGTRSATEFTAREKTMLAARTRSCALEGVSGKRKIPRGRAERGEGMPLQLWWQADLLKGQTEDPPLIMTAGNWKELVNRREPSHECEVGGRRLSWENSKSLQLRGDHLATKFTPRFAFRNTERCPLAPRRCAEGYVVWLGDGSGRFKALMTSMQIAKSATELRLCGRGSAGKRGLQQRALCTPRVHAQPTTTSLPTATLPT